jgi:hypothetical protein
VNVQWIDLDDPAGHERYVARRAKRLVAWPTIAVLLAGLLSLTALWLWWS